MAQALSQSRLVCDLYARLDRVYAKEAKFRSLTESFDFDTMTGKFVLGILGLVAELERQIIAHRTKAGIETWRAAGKGKWGRRAIMSEAQVKQAGKLLASLFPLPKARYDLCFRFAEHREVRVHSFTVNLQRSASI